MSSVREPASLPESNMREGPTYPFAPDVSSAGTLAARLRQHPNSPITQIRAQTVDTAILGSQRVPTPRSQFRSETGRPLEERGLYYGRGESRGRRLTDAGIRTRSHPDFYGAWQAVTSAPTGLGIPRGSESSSRQRPIDHGRKAFSPEIRLAGGEDACGLRVSLRAE